MKKLLVLSLLLISIAGCERDDDDKVRNVTGPGVVSPAPKFDRVEFRVFGSNLFSQVNIRYQDPRNGTTLVTSTVPYFAEVTNQENNAFLFLEAS